VRQSVEISKTAHDAVAILGQMIRAARMKRKMTAQELAIRVNVSRGVIQRIEKGHPGTLIGTAFEAAVVLGIPLFDVAAPDLNRLLKHQQEINVLLPKRAYQTSQIEPDYDF